MGLFNGFRLGEVAAFENRRPLTEAKFIIKSSLFILLLNCCSSAGTEAY
jgi:hypothetical protein